MFAKPLLKPALGAVMLLAAASASAVPVTFFGEDTSTAGILGPNSAAARADFLSNLTGVGNEDFESFNLGDAAPLTLSFPGSAGGLTATLQGNATIDQTGQPGNPGRFATSGTNFLETTTGQFSIEFGTAISAFGFNGIDIGDFVTAQLTLELANGESVNLTVPHSLNIGNSDNATLFFGFFDTENTYTSITFTNAGGGDLFAFDDMIIGDREQITVTVPAPAPLGLLGLGLIGLAVSRGRKLA